MIQTVRVGGRDIIVALHQSIEEIARLRDPWKALVCGSASSSAFITWEWLYSWSERYLRGDRRPFVLSVSEGTEVIGIAPWYRHAISLNGVPLREIGFLGLPEAGSDYLDVIASRG